MSRAFSFSIAISVRRPCYFDKSCRDCQQDSFFLTNNPDSSTNSTLSDGEMAQPFAAGGIALGHGIGNRGLLQHPAGRLGDLLEGLPHLACFLIGTIEAAPVGGEAEAWQRRNRPVDQPQHIEETDLAGRLDQNVAAKRAAPALHHSG